MSQNKAVNLLMLFFLCGLKYLYIETHNHPNKQLKDELISKINAGIPEWMTKQIAEDLADVTYTGITREMISNTLKQDSVCLFLFKIKNGKIDLEYNTQMSIDGQRHASAPIVAILTELNKYIPLPNVEFIYSIDDAPLVGKT